MTSSSDTPLHHRGARDLAAAIARGETTSRALVDTMLERIARFNPALNAVVVLRADEARAAADAADRARADGNAMGPLHGVPISIKECFDWAGTASTFGHPERREHRATHDATVVARLKAAGAIVIGKTNVPKDLADWQSFNAVYGSTSNPWDLARSPGGSSGGSACALAAGFSALEVGSDIGGSIRMPAHFCGVYGHKPTYGLVPFGGHAMAPSAAPDDLSVIGPLSRRATDLDLALRLIAGPQGAEARAWRLDLPEPGLKALQGARIAVISDAADFPVDREISQACRNVASALADAGAKVTLDPPLPLPERKYYELYLGLLRGATSVRRDPAQLAQLAQKQVALDLNDSGYEALMLRGLTQSHRQWLEYANQRQALRERWEAFFGHHDAVIAPVSPTTAFPHTQNTPKETQTLSVNGMARPNADTYYWLGLASVPYLPATTFPADLSAAGLPIGLQIIGPEFADLACIALANQLETLIGGFQPPPFFR